MRKPPHETRGPAPEPPTSERLESWKEIAAYLKRDVSTVQRWEKQEGLPVRRHVHSKLATVYAHRPDLDTWWNNRRSSLEEDEKGEQVGRAATRRRLRLAAVAGIVLAVSVGGSLLLLRRRPLAFEERDWVLIASFENRTRETVFDGTLEYALARELSNSRFVNVVPRERIEDTLQLMRKPPGTSIDATLGREICLRDAGIRALVTGRVERLDTTYVLSAALVDPARGVTVAAFSEEATGQKEVVPALQRLCHRMRQTLGEKLSMIEQSGEKLARVTTPSLHVLQLYSQADVAIVQSGLGDAVAEELLKQALAEDPEFAAGYIHLAWAIRNQGRPQSLWGPHARRALQLADTANDRERYFIHGSYSEMMGEDEQAIAAYKALLQLYPNHFWGVNNLAHLLWVMGRPEEAIPYQVQRAEMRPNDFRANIEAAWALSGNLSRAKPYIQRARTLSSPETARLYPEDVGWIELFPAWEYWVQGNIQQALSEVDREAASVNSRTGEERAEFAFLTGLYYLPFGKLNAAEKILGSIPAESSVPRWAEAMVLFVRDDQQALRDHFRRYAHTAQTNLIFPIPAILMVRAGLLPEAQRMLSSLEKNPTWKSTAAAVAGELALAHGKTEEAIPLLESGMREARSRGLEPIFFLASESLARAWERQGDTERARRVLQQASQAEGSIGVLWPMAETLWMRTQSQLAQLYRKTGREEQAQEIEERLLKKLAYADPNHPILVQLKRLHSPKINQ